MAGLTKDGKLDETNDQQGEGISTGEASIPEPTNLADAFKAYRDQNASMANEPVQDGEPTGEPATEGTDGTPAGDIGATTGEGELGAGEPADLGQTGGSGDTGGFADAPSGMDYESYDKALVDQIGNLAIQSVQQKFAEQGINKITISQLYQRDEDSGSVSFINPDDPRHPFTSRAEAQAWCNAFNQDYEAEFRRAAVAERDRLLNQYKPARELMKFGSKYEQFDETKKQVFDNMVEDYAIKDQSGRVVGYSCNLDAMSKRADQLIAMFNKPAPQAAQADPPANTGTEPALDMKGSGSGTSGTKEPKDLAEALKMVQAEKKGKK